MTNKIGRPTKYTPELLDKTREYIENYESFGDVVPTIVGLSIFLGINRDTLYDWAAQEDKKDFSDMLDQIQSIQQKVLINKGLMNVFNSNICKLMLAKHGYNDKTDIGLTDKDGNDREFIITIVD